jgi:2-keto-4-pentenoate hydratase/2-oxohepta-3-ene-1,7-dioic acid hydratase in catechol pathway
MQVNPSPAIVSYRLSGRSPVWVGAVLVGDGERVVDLAQCTNGRVASTRALLALGPHAVEAAVEEAERQLGDQSRELNDECELGPPIPDPDKIIGLGLNYREHAAESDVPVPEILTFFTMFRNALVGNGADVVLPAVSSQIDYEGELAVVIGTRCKDVAEADALACVGGFATFNDVSARDIQLRTGQWTAGKTLDTFGPMGALVPAARIDDPQKLQLTTRLNDTVVQTDSTANQVFSVAATVAYLSSLFTLEPGDIVATGTTAGVGFAKEPPSFLKHGDIVEVEIDGLGILRNRFVNGVPPDERD